MGNCLAPACLSLALPALAPLAARCQSTRLDVVSGLRTVAMELQLTSSAAEAVRARAREAGVSDHLLRIAVVAGGCNGLSYDLYLVPEALPEDAVVESSGVRVAVDAASARLLDGTRVDLRGRSFVFRNPRARNGCSCG